MSPRHDAGARGQCLGHVLVWMGSPGPWRWRWRWRSLLPPRSAPPSFWRPWSLPQSYLIEPEDHHRGRTIIGFSMGWFRLVFFLLPFLVPHYSYGAPMSRLSLHGPDTPHPAGPGPLRPKGPSIQASKFLARGCSHPTRQPQHQQYRPARWRQKVTQEWRV